MSARAKSVRVFRAFDADFRKSALWRKIVRQHPKSRVKDFRCFIDHLIECCGQTGATCDDSVLSGFEATYGEDPAPLIEYLSEEGFMRYDEETGWIWLISGVWWQNAVFNCDCSKWSFNPDSRATHNLKGQTGAMRAWTLVHRELLTSDFPFKREFIEAHYADLRLDIAELLTPGFREAVMAAIGTHQGSDSGPTPGRGGSDGGSDPGQRGVGRGVGPRNRNRNKNRNKVRR